MNNQNPNQPDLSQATNLVNYLQNGQQNNPVNTLLQYGLPIAGGLLGAAVPGLGETGISEGAGAAGGQFLADKLTGQQPGADVAVTGLGGLAGPLLGKILGGVGGKATQIADKLIGKPTSDVFNSVVQKDPWMTQNVAKLTKTADQFGYMDQGIGSSLNQMPQDFKNINDQITTKLKNNNTDVPLVGKAGDQGGIYQNFMNQLKNVTSGSPGDPQYDNAVKKIINQMVDLSNGGDNVSLQDVYKEKQAMGKNLTKFFNSNAAPTPPGEVMNAYYQGLKDTIDQFGDSGIRDLNTQQNHLFDIAKAFGTKYQQMAASNGNLQPFSFRNLFPEELGGLGAAAIGQSPILGAILGAGVNKAANSAPLMGGLGKILGATGKLAGSPVGIGAGITGAKELNNALGLSILPVLNGSTQGNNQQQNQINQNNSSFLPQTISQQSTNSNGQNAQLLKLANSNESVPTQLPNASDVANTIPNQPFPVAQQQAELAKIQANAGKYAGSPLGMQAVDQELSVYSAKKALNDEVVNNYLQQAGLTPQEASFVQAMPPVWGAMMDLQQAIQQNGGQGLLQTIINSSPTVNQLRAIADTTGNYGHMLQLMQYVQEEIGRLYAGGAVTDYQAKLFGNAFSPGNNTATNIQNLNQAMKQIYDQYKQYTPRFQLLLNANQQQIQNSQNVMQYGQGGGGKITSSDLLNSILQKAIV